MGAVQVQGLPETEREVLAYLSVNREASRYMVEKGIGRAYSGVHGAIKTLQENGLVEAVREEPNKRNPKIQVEYYSLTRLGFYGSLLLDPVLENLDNVAEAHEEKLHLILGKWGLFRGVEPMPERAPGLTLDWLIRYMLKVSVRKNLALLSLSSQSQWFQEEFGRELGEGIGDTILLELYDVFLVTDLDRLEYEVYLEVFFGRDLMGVWRHWPPVREAFIAVAAGDVDLRNFFRKETRNRIIELEAELKEIRNQ